MNYTNRKQAIDRIVKKPLFITLLHKHTWHLKKDKSSMTSAEKVIKNEKGYKS